MCVIKDKYTEAKEFTGYKVALKHKETGEYYSPYTGSVYREGRRMRPRKTALYLLRTSKAIEVVASYEPKMQGKTGVLVHEKNALELLKDYGYFPTPWINPLYEKVLLKMTIKGGLYNATFNNYPTVIGSHIVSIKQLS